MSCRWVGNSVLQAWENWRIEDSQDSVRSLPLLVIWGVWLARNNLFFVDKACTPKIAAGLSCGILTAFPEHIKVSRHREALEVEIDKSIPWGFFDGATQNNLCGGGALLFLSETTTLN